MKKIHTPETLTLFADNTKLRNDWHSPDNQGVTATVEGTVFDNAGFWGTVPKPNHEKEMFVTFLVNGLPTACVNLATLCAWAAEYGRTLSKSYGVVWANSKVEILQTSYNYTIEQAIELGQIGLEYFQNGVELETLNCELSWTASFDERPTGFWVDHGVSDERTWHSFSKPK